MSRWPIVLLFAGLAAAQQGDLKDSAKGAPKDALKDAEADLPPDEDAAAHKAEEFSFNPVKSQRDVSVGMFYFKSKKDYKAAAQRFRDATKWNDGNAEAWLWLGEADEKLPDPKAAREAYTKYLQLAPQAKNAAEVRKRLARLL